MKRMFLESRAFSQFVRSGKFSDRQLKQLQYDIMKGHGETVTGTGGFKKIRCGSQHAGKRGGWRVIFADYPKCGITILVAAFSKNVQENLSQSECNELKRLKEILDKEVNKRYGQNKEK